MDIEAAERMRMACRDIADWWSAQPWWMRLLIRFGPPWWSERRSGRRHRKGMLDREGE